VNGKYVHYLPGGGLGDVVREAYFNGALGILKRWKMLHPRAELRVVVMSHNASAVDLLQGHTWIDDISSVRFPLEKGWGWEGVYDWYPELFADRTELRFTLPEKKSIYRIDLNSLRKKIGPVESILPMSMACDVELTRHERDVVAYHAGSIVLHPFAGEAFRSWPSDLTDEVLAAAGRHGVVVGANYAREGHAEEECNARVLTFAPRVLVSIVRQARAVVGAESSVYYMGGMWGRPVAMLWAPNGSYDLVQQGTLDWNWYFGLEEPSNFVASLTMDRARREELLEWVRAKAD
jgi:hypothetical protein